MTVAGQSYIKGVLLEEYSKPEPVDLESLAKLQLVSVQELHKAAQALVAEGTLTTVDAGTYSITDKGRARRKQSGARERAEVRRRSR